MNLYLTPEILWQHHQGTGKISAYMVLTKACWVFRRYLTMTFLHDLFRDFLLKNDHFRINFWGAIVIAWRFPMHNSCTFSYYFIFIMLTCTAYRWLVGSLMLITLPWHEPIILLRFIEETFDLLHHIGILDVLKSRNWLLADVIYV